jgi:hypothetical protein
MMIKKDKLKNKIIDLVTKTDFISVHDVSLTLGLTKLTDSERKSIQRALKELITEKLIKPKGYLKARVYTLNSKLESVSIINESQNTKIQNIPMSKNSALLIKFLAKKQNLRAKADYQIQFLNSYIPNKSFYLSLSERNKLKSFGTSENEIHPVGTYARHILDRLLIELSWNSSRLEGNTYSLLQTKKLIESGESADGKKNVETQMILNHKAAIEYIVELADEKSITSHHICNIHALLSDNLLTDVRASGRIRDIAVGITGSNYKPLSNPDILKKYFELFIKKMNLIKNPFEQSFFALIHLPYLQAFEDVNKRTSRLVGNIPLIKANLRPLSFTDVEQETYTKALLGVYEKNDISLIKDLYLWAYEQSSQKYSAVQQTIYSPNPIKFKYRLVIQAIIRNLILEKTTDKKIVQKIRDLIEKENVAIPDRAELFKIIEIEIISLHTGNFARFKIKPSEFQAWLDSK